jgi:hydroxymethylbilane synthase
MTRLKRPMDFERPSPAQPLKIGTRGSPLALAQAYETRNRLMAAFGLTEDAFEVVIIKVTGDMIQDRPLKEIGGKGLFTREIEEDLLSGKIDIAVHSMKDMPTIQPDGLLLDVYLPREDVRDAFISPALGSIADLAPGAVVGTSSLRRRAQLLNRRPDLNVVEFRGNVQTRLKKLDDGVAECTFLATAGLKRLGRDDVPATPVDPSDMLPAVAQGAIGIERRANDDRMKQMLGAIHDTATGQQLAAERAFLKALDGSCETPIAGLALLEDGRRSPAP